MSSDKIKFCEGCPIAGACNGELSYETSKVAGTDFMYSVWLGDKEGNNASIPIHFPVAVDFVDSVMDGEAVSNAMNLIKYCDGRPDRRLFSPRWWPQSLGKLGVQACGAFPGQIPRQSGMRSRIGLVGGW